MKSYILQELHHATRGEEDRIPLPLAVYANQERAEAERDRLWQAHGLAYAKAARHFKQMEADEERGRQKYENIEDYIAADSSTYPDWREIEERYYSLMGIVGYRVDEADFIAD